MRYAYYPGCYAKGTAPELDDSTRIVCERLGIELEELTAAPCCGAGDVQQVDGPLAQGLNELTLAQAQHLGLDILTVCNVCTLSLRQANVAFEEGRHLDEGSACLAVADPGCAASADPGIDAAPQVNGPVPPGFGQRWPLSAAEAASAAAAALAPEGLAYAGGVGVTHLLWALWKDVGVERLAEQVQQRLGGLTLAPFYGCQILRPADVNGDDVADDPTALEELIAACGAAAVDYDGRLKCCGWPVMYVRQAAAAAMAARTVRNAAAAGADAIVTPCPLCHAALEGCQSSSAAAGSERLRLPVLHLPQVIGLALGCSPRRLGLIDHAVDARPLLARLGLTLT